MLKDIIAKRYAKALLALADKAGKTDVVKADINSLADTFRTSKSLQSVFMNPAFSASDKAKVLKGLEAELKLSELSARFMDLLLEKGRFRYVREVASAYSELLDLKQGVIKATVTTPQAMTETELGKLKAKIKTLVGKDVDLKVEVNESLIGGISTRVGSTVYDGSLQNQLKQMRTALLKG